jgi:hypothetical protein
MTAFFIAVLWLCNVAPKVTKEIFTIWLIDK